MAAAATHPGHQPIPEVISNVTAGDGASLAGVRGLDVFAADAGLYVVAAASSGDAILVINVTDPYDPGVISSVVDDGATALDGASAVDVVRIGSGLYAVVASANDDGLQVINLTDPADPVPVAGLTDDGTVELAGAYDVATFAAGLGTYAVVASANDDGLQVINLTDPADPVPVAGLADNQTTALAGAVAVDTIRIGSGLYAVVASANDDGLQIVNLTRPADPVPVAGLADDGTVHLDGARAVAALDRGLGTYAVVASDDGLQVVEVTDPTDPVPVARIPDGSANVTLRDASAVDTFMMDGGTYAMVATADGMVVVDLTDPAGPVPVEAAQNGSALRGASALKAFRVAGHAYAAVAVPDGGGAIRIVSLGELDIVPPAISSAAWMPANRTISLVFSESLDHAATIYPEITILGESASLTLADISSRTATGGAIAANLSLAQEAALGVPEAVQLSEGAVRDVPGNPIPPTSLAVTLDDFVPPAVSSATYEPGTGLLTVSFSEPLNHTATIYRDIAVAGPIREDALRISVLLAFIYPDIAVAGPVHLYTLDEISVGTALGTTIEATLDAAQAEAVGSAPMLYMMEGAVRDIWSNPIGLVRGLAVTVLDPDDAPALASSSYNTGTGVLNMTFSEPLNGTVIHYGRMAVRDAGQSSGGLILDGVASRALGANSTMVTLTLSAAQRQMINAMASPQLDIGAGAVADIAGNGILAAPDQNITVMDGIPPTISSAAYEPGTGILVITFSEPLGPAVDYSGMVLAGESGNVALDDIFPRDHSIDTITATLDATQRTAVGDAMTLSVSEGAVADTAGNRIARATARVAVTDDIPPVLASSSYNTGTGVLIIAFSEPLGPTIHYDRITVRDAGRSSGGLSLGDVDIRAVDHSSATMVLSLSAAQRQTVNGMAAPQLAIGAGAIADAAGNEILAAPDRSITVMDGIPPTVSSATYNTGTGVLVITFSESLGLAIAYSGVSVVGPAGSVALDDVASRSRSTDTITATLDAAQRSAAGDSPTLSVLGGAVADISGNPVSPASNIRIAVETPPVVIIPANPPPDPLPRPPANTAPTANAGDPQTVTEGAAVSLDGALSSDPEDASLSYSWAHTSGPAISLTGPATATPSFTAPNVGETRDIVLTLTVTDSGSLTDTDTVTITVNDSVNKAPTADAGANQNATEGDTVTLSGTASDADAEDNLTYAWTLNNTALGITLSSTSALDTSFAAPNVAADTPVLFTLTVSDNTASSTDTVLVTIRDSANSPPTANAGANQTVTEGATVTLSGTASDDDPEDTSLSYSWAHTSGPAVTLTGSATATPSFEAPNVAATQDIILTLTVTDSGSLTDTDTVTITVNDSVNKAPTADAGANQTVTEGSTVSLNGTASDDDPEDSPTYAWTFNNTALGITLSSTSALDTSFTAPNVAADTPVLFTLTVSDGTVSATDTALVTIRDSANSPPTANAGANQTVTEGATVSLNGTASDDDPEDASLSYSWAHTSGPAISLTGSATATPSFTAPNVGETRDIILTLTVTDSGSLTGTDTVTITVNDSPNTAPTANAGANQTVTEGATVSLNGTASDTDPEDTLSYEWTHNSSLTIPLSSTSALDTSFAAPNVAADTPVLFTLTVSDGTASSTDTVLVTIRDSANSPPTANAGANQTVTEGATVSLNGTASDDDPEDSPTYAWTFNNTALGITLDDAAALDTSFTAPNVAADTPVLFTLTVSDGTASSTDTVLVTIRDSANSPPTANAGANQTVAEGATVTLSGTASDDDPEDTSLSYSWAHTSGPAVTLTRPCHRHAIVHRPQRGRDPRYHTDAYRNGFGLPHRHRHRHHHRERLSQHGAHRQRGRQPDGDRGRHRIPERHRLGR